MNGDFYSYLNSRNLVQKKPQEKCVAVVKKTIVPVFSESGVNEFSRKWLAEQGFDCCLSDDSGFKDGGGALISVDGISEEDKDRAVNILQDLVDAIEEHFGSVATFSKTNEIPECEEELGADGIPTGTYKVRISYDYQPYTDEMTQEEKDLKKSCINLLKSSGAI